MHGRQASIHLIRIIRCPGSLLGFQKAPLWLDDFEPEGFINYLGVTCYVELVGYQAGSHPCAEFKWDLPRINPHDDSDGNGNGQVIHTNNDDDDKL